MRPLTRAALALFALAALAGCASTKVTSRQTYNGAQLPRPDRILVENFGATASDVPPSSELGAEAAGAEPQTPEDVELGRKLGRRNRQAADRGHPEHGAARPCRRWARCRGPTTS